MIIYQERFAGYNILFRLYGSPWPRAFVLALPGTVFGVLASLFAQEYVMTLLNHPAAYLIYGTLVTFGVVFRTNLSYTRYWEGCTAVRTMSAKWADAAIQVLSFDEAAEKHDQIEGGLRFRAEFIHAISLMHGLALQKLRGDADLDNIDTGSFMETPKPPPVDASEVGSWNAMRKKRKLFVLRSSERHFKEYWQCFPLTVIGGINTSERDILDDSDDRVFLVLCWILRAIGSRRLEGGIKAEGPFVSRIYQVLSDGMLAYENALKIAITPFPFPFAQSVTILLHLNSFLAPLTMARWCGAAWLDGLLSFLSLFSFYLLNEVAREIEQPFSFEPNDLPFPWYQHNFNQHLVTAFVKSLLPHDPGVFFTQIAGEDQMRRMLALHRPSAQRRALSAVIDIDTEVSVALTEDENTHAKEV